VSIKKVEANEQLTDEQLVERIKNGDEESLSALIKSYMPKVFHRVQSLVPECDAEDVTQDIFMSLVDSIDSFKGRSAFATWFHRISMNKVADYHRKMSRRREQLTEDQISSSFNPWGATNDELIVTFGASL